MKVLIGYGFAAVTTFAILVFGCDFGEIKSTATTGEMTLAVDENQEQLMRAEVSEFERLNKEAKVSIQVAPTNKVLADIINGEVNNVVASRTFNEEERKIIEANKSTFKEYPVAIDGIAFIVNPDNPAVRVTSNDLRAILSGEIKNWSSVVTQDDAQNKKLKALSGSPADKILVFIQRKNSSTYDYVKDSILAGAEYSTAAAICSTSVQMLASVREKPGALGIANMSWLSKGVQEEIDSTVRPLRVSKIFENGRQTDFAEFHQGYLANASYPYRRTIYLITADQDIKLSTGFLTFLLRTDGQKIVLKYGLVPVTQPVRTIQIN